MALQGLDVLSNPKQSSTDEEDATSGKLRRLRNDEEMGAAPRQNPLFYQFAHLPYRKDRS